MNRLTIQNIHKLTSYLSPFAWYYSGWMEGDDRYEFAFHHNVSGEKRVFVLSRHSYLFEGEPHYETYIVGRRMLPDRITHRFLTNPHNLARHIIVLIERY